MLMIDGDIFQVTFRFKDMFCFVFFIGQEVPHFEIPASHFIFTLLSCTCEALGNYVLKGAI